MKTLLWTLLLLVGFGLMLGAHYRFMRVTEPTLWTESWMYIGGEAGPEAEDLDVTRARVRDVDFSSGAAKFLRELESGDPDAARPFRRALRRQVIFYPPLREDFTEAHLAAGRLPRPGSDEALAGYAQADAETVTVAGRTLRIVGTLRREVGLFSRAYLVQGDSSAAPLFNPDDEGVRHAYIFTMAYREARKGDVADRLKAAFPKGTFETVTPATPVSGSAYWLYLAGTGMLYLGGSALFMRLYWHLGWRVKNRTLGRPLRAMLRYRGLLWTLHIATFGLLILGGAVAWLVPPAQDVLLDAMSTALQSGEGPLGAAGKAYGSGSVPRAALVTFGVNFFFGSVASITLPSLVVPGVGVLMLVLRPLVVGIALAPTLAELSGVLLPHAFTILVELEAYILAGYFALLVPIWLFRCRAGRTVPSRYGRAVLLNLQGSLLVAVILAVAAVYEAIEVIAMIKKAAGGS